MDQSKRKNTKVKSSEFLRGEFQDLVSRGISEETCRKFGYQVGSSKDGSKVQIAPYYDKEGELVGQKIRDAKKNFSVIGKVSNSLFGQNVWGTGGKRVVVTEGEIDALSYAEVSRNWPVVSVPNGAAAAKKAIEQHLGWLETYDEVVIAFDNDEPGQKAAQECARLFTPGKCKIARLDPSYKDFNEALKEGNGKAIANAVFQASEYRPDGVVKVRDLIDEAKKPITVGLPWVFETLTKSTFGRRPGEVIMVGAGTGVGKTDFLTQQIAYDVTVLEKPCGLFFLEQKPVETLKRVAGKIAGRTFHIPDSGWTQQELDETLEHIDWLDRLRFYDNFGATDWDIIASTITHLAQAEGYEIFYIDHLTALADTSNERESLEEIMKQAAMLANRLQIILVMVSHLATPDGTPHEEGGRVMIRHFKGARAIGFWSYFMFGLERDQQHEDETIRQQTTFRVLKDRYTGQATGRTFLLNYDSEHGRLYEPDGFDAPLKPAPVKGEHNDF